MKQKKAIALEKLEDFVFPEDDVEDHLPADIEDDPEIWFDYFSEDVAAAYHILRDRIDAQGIPLLDKCTFTDFAEFCYMYSSGRKPIC